MVWHSLLLFVAIACETLATGLLKVSDGMTRVWPTVGMLVGYVASLFLLSLVLKSLPVGPVYAVWSGLGTAVTALVGYWAFGDRLPPGAWLGLGLVVAGVALLSIYLPRAD
ncbi:DMT family transporter [Frigoriglobus tundricola]|uniref:Ethidium bromide-methyl viologen resistance protein EmrE n=1 Tax=Frigoriglobus tundricola TaxID=2774151 RepID=A0A6M5Z1I0_9BACT|nr:multidrug efflux SMR transporter [Frigoriglobus tundricola]QJW99271.1 Ethidium bromide-methyl viologen resistance protein EmrE [Frigoriglobus tundricola]